MLSRPLLYCRIHPARYPIYEIGFPGNADSKLGYYVRGGGLYNQIEVDNSSGNKISDSGHGIGWQAGGGLHIELTPNLQLRPGVKFQALSRDLAYADETAKMSVDLTYVAADLGVVISF